MKKTFNKFFSRTTLALCMVGTLGVFASCSDSDSDGNIENNKNVGLLDAETGLRVNGVGSISYYYNEDGTLNYIKDSGYNYTFDKNTITYEDPYEPDIYKVSYNSKGYISSSKWSYSGSGSDYSWTETEDDTYSYDSEGHLTKISMTGKDTGVDDGEKYTVTMTSTYNLTWKNGLLNQVTYTYKETEDGETTTVNRSFTFEYKNNLVNKYQQWVPAMVNAVNDDFVEIFAYCGMVGKGPLYLPTSREAHYNYNGYYDNTVTDNYSYNLNKDGSIYSASGVRYYYSYGEINTPAMRNLAPNTKQDRHTPLHKLRERKHIGKNSAR